MKLQHGFELSDQPWNPKKAQLMRQFLQLLFVCSLIGCASRPTTEERLVELAFEAIKEGNWEKYETLTITYADFLLKDRKTNRFEERMSYAGGVLKPEQQQQHKREFARAVQGGENQIDFKQWDFVAIGNVIHSGELEDLEGPGIPYKLVALQIENKGMQVSTVSSYPRFMIVRWNEEFRIMRLEFLELQAKKDGAHD